MNHTPRTEELSAYLDGRLAAAERAELERHIDSCPLCREELQELRATVSMLRALPAVRPPRSFTLDPAKVAPRRSSWLPRLRWASIALSLLLMLTVGLDLSKVGMEQLPAMSSTGSAAATSAPAALPTAGAPRSAAGSNPGDKDTIVGQSGGAPESNPPAVPANGSGEEAEMHAEATATEELFAAAATEGMAAAPSASAVAVMEAQPTVAADAPVFDAGPEAGMLPTASAPHQTSTDGGALVLVTPAPQGTVSIDDQAYVSKSTENALRSSGSPGDLVQTTQPTGGEGTDTWRAAGDEGGVSLLPPGDEAAGTTGEAVQPAPQEPTAGARAWLRAFEILVGALLAISLVALAVLSRRSS